MTDLQRGQVKAGYVTIISRSNLTHVTNKVACHNSAAATLRRKDHKCAYKISLSTRETYTPLYLVLVHNKKKLNDKSGRKENWKITQLQASVVFKITRLMGVVMYDLTPTTPTSETTFDWLRCISCGKGEGKTESELQTASRNKSGKLFFFLVKHQLSHLRAKKTDKH